VLVDTSHDRFACPRVISQQETQWLSRKHTPIDCSDLMRERVDQGGVNGEVRIEKMGEMQA
jgi:hypothetical protein